VRTRARAGEQDNRLSLPSAKGPDMLRAWPEVIRMVTVQTADSPCTNVAESKQHQGSFVSQRRVVILRRSGPHVSSLT
jgi:hypothetical protein